MKDVYGDVRINMCWAHASYNIYKAADRINQTVIKMKIRGDIEILQLSFSDSEYQLGLNLFIQKWSIVKEYELPSVKRVEELNEELNSFMKLFIVKKEEILDRDILNGQIFK